MYTNSRMIYVSANIFLLLLSQTAAVFAQVRRVMPDEIEMEVAEDYTWWYVTLFFLIAGLIGAIYWKIKDKAAKEAAGATANQKRNNRAAELEWVKKNKPTIRSRTKSTSHKKEFPASFSDSIELPGSDSVEAEYESLPIFSINRLERARPFDALPVSSDETLLEAIERVSDELEEDEQVREAAVNVLKEFKTRNCVQALSEVALYDLSSALRSKAVTILSEFDHESVFEAVLSACADPTREVRAAAARALFRLSFDRADAWTRISESGDEFRMRHAARAAIAGDLVERSFDRLTHKDQKIVYEVFCLVALLINAGETKEIFRAIETHKNHDVKLALLHIIKVIKKEETLSELYSLLETGNVSSELEKAINETIESFELMPIQA